MRLEKEERDTVRDAETSMEVRVLMDRIARGEPVVRTELVAQLERMLALVVQTDADFNCLALLVRRRSSLVFTTDDVLDVDTLRDGTAVIHTAWTLASREGAMARIQRAFPDWLVEHDDLRGVPSFSASHMDLVRSALSYEDAVNILGEGATFLR